MTRFAAFTKGELTQIRLSFLARKQNLIDQIAADTNVSTRSGSMDSTFLSIKWKMEANDWMDALLKEIDVEIKANESQT